MDKVIAYGLIAIGLIVIAYSVNAIRRQPRVSMFSSSEMELLMMPAHERLARAYARIHGAPEFEWRRFTHLAVAEIIRRDR
jgi:hypothetical protein